MTTKAKTNQQADVQVFYKTLHDQNSVYGGKQKWVPMKWTPKIKGISLCERGYHLTTNPFNWTSETNQIWVAQPRGKTGKVEGDKHVFESARITRRLSMEEIRELWERKKDFPTDKFLSKYNGLESASNFRGLFERVDKIRFLEPVKEISKNKLTGLVSKIFDHYHFGNPKFVLHKINAKSLAALSNKATQDFFAKSRDKENHYTDEQSKFVRMLNISEIWWEVTQVESHFTRSARIGLIDFCSPKTKWNGTMVGEAMARWIIRALRFQTMAVPYTRIGVYTNPYLAYIELMELGFFTPGIGKDGVLHLYYVPAKGSKKGLKVVE